MILEGGKKRSRTQSHYLANDAANFSVSSISGPTDLDPPVIQERFEPPLTFSQLPSPVCILTRCHSLHSHNITFCCSSPFFYRRTAIVVLSMCHNNLTVYFTFRKEPSPALRPATTLVNILLLDCRSTSILRSDTLPQSLRLTDHSRNYAVIPGENRP